MKRIVLTIITTTLALITISFLLTLETRLSLSYNSEGNYFDENSATVYSEQAVIVYAILSILFLALTTFLTYLTIKAFKTKKKMKR